MTEEQTETLLSRLWAFEEERLVSEVIEAMGT